ncbi:MAG TPA: DapH/DapD/GlmU-related protein [Smithellaceae bacterium]|jgi:acetyltransferase-like isoleucine patch superfamily enzyme|nr:DapH/DapD/GlmU-related protein [Smithellaceae bacterium]HQG81709.1 DapH/DapD/GlmU-related protein [Smithellaceae bacterium]
MSLKHKLIVYLKGFYPAFVNFIINLPPNDTFSNLQIRPRIAKMFGVRCVNKCKIRKPIYIQYHKNITIGNNSFIFGQSYIDAMGSVTIGNNVRIAPQVMIVTGTHEIGKPEHRAGETLAEPIVIGDGCWIGARVTITSGVTIGKGCIVSAGSVVMRSMPPHSLIAGNPARPIQKLDAPQDAKVT